MNIPSRTVCTATVRIAKDHNRGPSHHSHKAIERRHNTRKVEARSLSSRCTVLCFVRFRVYFIVFTHPAAPVETSQDLKHCSVSICLSRISSMASPEEPWRPGGSEDAPPGKDSGEGSSSGQGNVGRPVMDLFGTDVVPAAIVLVLVLLGLMKGTSPVSLPTNPTGKRTPLHHSSDYLEVLTSCV